MSNFRYSSMAFLTGALLTCAAACDDEGDQSVNTAPLYAAGSTGTVPDAGTVSNKLTDAQVISALSTANAGEIERSTLASEAAQAESVRMLAGDLSSMHLAGQERLTTLVSNAGFSDAFNVTDADNAVSQELQLESKQIVTRLRDAAAPSFDLLYLQTEIDVQNHVLVVIDATLLPSAQDLLLRYEVQRLRDNTIAGLARTRALAALVSSEDGDAGLGDTDGGL